MCPSKTPLERQRCNSFSVAETSDPRQPHHIYFSLQERSITILNTIRRTLQFLTKYLTKHMSTMVTFSAALENIMRHLEWEDLGVKVDGRFLHHLRFADDIVLITPNIERAERMLAEFDSACGKIGLKLNLTKMMFMKNGPVPDAPCTINGTNIS
uniref:Reverse transcriptase domain-containing protein n=1 Tax=Haemonchus contortus TaxID=6289 RepID=A0A7I5E7K9_HAECO